MPGKIRKYLFGALLTALCLMLAACAPKPAGAQSYIATVTGGPTSARVGIVVEEGHFAAYVCSLDDAFNLTSARWYEGELGADGAFQGVSPDGVEFRGTISGETFSGALLNTEQANLPFSGSLVPAGGPVGLYRGAGQYDGRDIVVGAVISSDGSFASTVQYKGLIEFVTPIGNQPQQTSDTSLTVNIGPDAAPYSAELVTTLEGTKGCCGCGERRVPPLD